MTNTLKKITFSLWGILILIMAAATIAGKLYGTKVAETYIYSSPFFIGLWIAATILSLTYICKRHLERRKATCALHLAFILILSGALTTHLWGIQGSVHLRQGANPVTTFTTNDGQTADFPFGVSLKQFELAYYQGTFAPMDFVSILNIHDGDTTLTGKVSMNHIYTYRHYRFYQSAYDADQQGSTLSVTCDPYGIALTYTGYVAMLLAFIGFFFDRHSYFRKLLHHPSLKRTVACLLLLIGSVAALEASVPPTLPKETAGKFGKLYVYYNNRICPLQTLAKEFTTKLYGRPTYKGFTSEQVLTGWLFYYEQWKQEPVILIKDKNVQNILGVKGKYACLADFANSTGYKLDQILYAEITAKELRAIEEADEKFNLISMACNGSLFKLYPFRDKNEKQPVWYSLTDELPVSIPHEQWAFIRYSMNLLAEKTAHQEYEAIDTLIEKTRIYQKKEARGFLPSDAQFRAEIQYNEMDFTRPLAMLCLTVGILSYLYYCRRMISRRNWNISTGKLLLAGLGIAGIYLLILIGLRGFISGHLPMSNGYETMQLMSLCSILLTFFLYRKFQLAISFGYILCGLTLLVAMLGEANPPVTQLMPVLASPLLSIHVVTIMLSYSLLAFVMLNGITAIILSHTQTDCGQQIIRLQVISQLILYPAVFLLATGIFIGAVWANVSWGRYWGWDPKEVWALITLLVYAAALHPASLSPFRRPQFFHWFTVIAFFSVLITYFGVNFIMGGMHSYA